MAASRARTDPTPRSPPLLDNPDGAPAVRVFVVRTPHRTGVRRQASGVRLRKKIRICLFGPKPEARSLKPEA